MVTKQKSLVSNRIERVGVVPIGLDVPKNPVISKVSGLGTFRATVFATLFSKTCFRADEIVPLGLFVKGV